MEKPADIDHPIHELIAQRWSPRAFSDRIIPAKDLQSLFEAARWASSCFNEQPWRFIVAGRDNPAEFEKLLACLGEKNQTWAKHASHLVLAVASMNFAHNGKPNRHAWHDVGLAVSQLALQATSLGISLHQMAGFDRDAARARYGIPDDYEPVAVTALGYPGDASALPEPLAEREAAPRSRRSQPEFVFTAAWGHSLPHNPP